ncbi:MAG: cupin domain-containing protein [Beijerinckiaceae bacterium]|nr:cupin domain-containing protein [Beijerinckiaceae bacterium]
MPDDALKRPLNFAGSLAIIRLSHAENLDGIAIIENRLPHGYATPLHIHETQDEVFQILWGRIRFEVAGKTLTAGSGDILHAPQGIPHRFIVESPDGANILVITRGRDFETFVLDVSSPISQESLCALTPMSEADIERVGTAAARNGIRLIGPPLTLPDVRQAAA